MQKWEYLRIKLWREKPRFTSEWTDFKADIGGRELKIDEFDKYMQTLGEQGWELVSVTPVAYWWDNPGFTNNMHYVFKRLKS